jgi:putative phosphoesterase
MKIAIISDSHDNEINLIRALTLINKEKVSALIHCGDVCSINTLNLILNNFKKNIYIALGNGDFNLNQVKFKNKNLKIFKDFGSFKISNKKIGITHFPDFIQKKLLSDSKNNYDLIFYGHTHKPWQDKINNTLIINPGNICGLFYKPTFALCDLNKLVLKLVIF